MREIPCNIETKIDEQHWKGEKSRHALLSEGNNSLHTLFCRLSSRLVLPYPTTSTPSPPTSVLLFYALNHQQRCRTELKHRMCCIYRIRHDPAACPGLFPLPIHILLLFRSPFHFPLRSHSCFPCCCPYPVVRVHLTCWAGAERGTEDGQLIVSCSLRAGQTERERDS